MSEPKSTLLSLPLDIVTLIERLLDAKWIVRLYMTGDIAMRWRLSKLIATFDLRWKGAGYLPLKSILASVALLEGPIEHFSLHMHEFCVHTRALWPVTWTFLPKSISTLSIDMVDSWALFTGDFSFQDQFPVLHTLKLLGPSSGKTQTRQFWPLPDSLTILHLSTSTITYHQSEISSLPRFLQVLKIGWQILPLQPGEVVNFPPNLKTVHLTIGKDAAFDLSVLPESPTNLKMSGVANARVISPTKSWRAQFPNLVKYSNLVHFHPAMALRELLPQLPKTLNYLDAPISSEPEDAGLVKKFARNFCVFGPMYDLPRSYARFLPNLTRLRIDASGYTPHAAVQYLNSETPTLFDTLVLTPNLTHLQCHEWDVKSGSLLFEMPPKLAHIGVQTVPLNVNTATTLPSSLTFLSAPFQDAKSFDGLMNLTKLQQLFIVNRKAPNNILQLPLSLKLLSYHHSPSIEFFESGAINHPALRTLYLAGAPCQHEIIPFLPSRLSSLRINLGTIVTAQDLENLPKALRNLEIRCDELRMDAAGYKKLPPSLTALTIHPSTRVTATYMHIAYALPPQISLLNFGGVEEHYRKIYPNHVPN